MKKLLLLLLIGTLAQGMHKNPDKPCSTNQEISFTKAFYHHDRNVTMIQATKDNSPLGEVTFDSSDKENKHGYIYSIDVDDSCRKQGIGYQLFKRAILELQKKGCLKIGWTALGLFEVSTEELEQIYLGMIKKLQKEKEFDFEFRMGTRQPTKSNGIKTPMEIALKESNNQIKVNSEKIVEVV